VLPTNGRFYDQTVADAAVRERREKRWFDGGTYECYLTSGEVTTLGGVCQILVGDITVGSSAATTGTTGNAKAEKIGTNFVIDAPGPYPVTIRKTTTNAGAYRFMECEFRKTA
jgi:hypothetical protein